VLSNRKGMRLDLANSVMKVWAKSTGEVRVELIERNPKTAETIWTALPFESTAELWGDEIYFKIPVKVQEEKSRKDVELGDVAYWPPGESMCIFFGPTPISDTEKPRAYSPVNVFGKVIGDPKIFRRVGIGEKIKVERES